MQTKINNRNIQHLMPKNTNTERTFPLTPTNKRTDIHTYKQTAASVILIIKVK